MFNIPFYSNTKDNIHCVQACLKSVLKFYFPKKNYSFSFLDKVTAHKKGGWTWDYALILFLLKKGFEIKYIVSFDLKRFVKEGEKYLKKVWTKEVYRIQKKYSNLTRERKLAKALLKEKRVKIVNKPATAGDLKFLFSKRYILFVPINPCVLDDKKGYLSHCVLITDINKNLISFHDPGLPPKKNRVASMKKFLRAMQYPYREAASLIAIGNR